MSRTVAGNSQFISQHYVFAVNLMQNDILLRFGVKIRHWRVAVIAAVATRLS
jgi:hypothetical protein